MTLINPGECRPNFTCGKASADKEGVVRLLSSGQGKVSRTAVHGVWASGASGTEGLRSHLDSVYPAMCCCR